MSSQRSRRPTNGSNSDQPPKRANGSANGLSYEDMSRAQRFEDEKSRIIESCFAKKEPDGAFAESYITHIPVWEDATSPSAPPPLNSDESNKKPRVIIVSVRRSGRVRLHKARENSNKSFSIGKTWILDHLSAIETFTGPALTPEDQERKIRAGDTGMLINIQKPYFWKAASSTEKEFFVGSLIKIFMKYTGGKTELDTDFGKFGRNNSSQGSLQRPKTPQTSSARPSPVPSPAVRPPASGLLPGSSGTPQESLDSQLRPPSAGSSSIRTIDSQERPAMPGGFPSDTPRGLKPQDAKLRFQPTRPEPLATTLRPPSAPREDRSIRTVNPASSTESFLSSRQDVQTPPAPAMNADRLRTNGGYSPLQRDIAPSVPVPGPRSPERATSRRVPSNSSASQEPIPERRRPPMPTSESNQASLSTTLPRFAASEEAPAPLEPRRTPLNAAFSDTKRQPPSELFSAPKSDPPAAEIVSPVEKEGRILPAVLPGAFSGLSSSPTESLPPESPAVPEAPEANHRPGLGPMIKKKSTKDIASTFMKAATAVNAFKPRAGGAGDRLRAAAKAAGASEADGINGVFTAPAAPKESLKSTQPSTPGLGPSPVPQIETPKAANDITDATRFPTPSPNEPVPGTPGLVPESANSPEKKKDTAVLAPEERKKRRPSSHYTKYAKAIGIDPALLEGRSAETEAIFADFGWGEDEKSKIAFEDLQANIRRDLAKVETGSWLGSFQTGDERVSAVNKLLDRAIVECEELDGLLTLYNVELGTLHEDVAYIEAQSQGLQVQTSNQRLLHTELQNLQQTITISASQLRVLQDASLSRPSDLQAVEAALSQLFKAMLTIDPRLRQHGRPTSSDGGSGANASATLGTIGAEVSTMRAVQEKKEGYRSQSVDFILRFKSHMSIIFGESEVTTRDAVSRSRSTEVDTSIDLRRRDPARRELWMYSPLMLFTREIDTFEWNSLINMYEKSAKRLYQDECRDNVAAWKRGAKKSTGDEQDILFTTQEKETEGSLVGRKLTVKRSKTLREGPRISSNEKAQDGKIHGYKAFANALFDTSSLLATEQNFASEMFHITSLETAEFPDLILSVPPEMRGGKDLTAHKQFDPDRNMAKRLQTFMDDMFSFWPVEIQNMVDWVVTQDPLQGIGVMCALESKYTELDDTNQEYIVNSLQQIHSRLTTRLDRFVEEQIRGIEDTKVKIKKRKGIISFIKIFPYFVLAVEEMLPAPRANGYEVRQLVNDVYIRINKSMFESLKFIAKESPVVMAGQKSQGQTGGDAEDKEILNYHIMLIQNMNHYTEEVHAHDNPVLSEWKELASKEMAEHMDLYLSAIVRRPLGKHLDSVEFIESLLATADASGDNAASVSSRASHQRQVFRSSLKEYDAKHVRHGIEVLKKRVEKHFGEADEALSRNLVVKVLQVCEERYLNILERTTLIAKDVYEGQLEIELKREDIVAAFRRS